MSICERCKRGGIGILHSAVRFSDKKYICIRCLKELGHDHPMKEAWSLALQTSEDILHPEIRWERERREACERRAARLDITPAQYERLDLMEATEFEMKLFSRMCLILEDEGCDSSLLALEPTGHGGIQVFLGDVLLLTYRGEPNLKWICLEDEPEHKIRFGQLSRLNSLADRIVALYQLNE